jgi:hypothetical protein
MCCNSTKTKLRTLAKDQNEQRTAEFITVKKVQGQCPSTPSQSAAAASLPVVRVPVVRDSSTYTVARSQLVRKRQATAAQGKKPKKSSHCTSAQTAFCPALMRACCCRCCMTAAAVSLLPDRLLASLQTAAVTT